MNIRMNNWNKRDREKDKAGLQLYVFPALRECVKAMRI